MSNYQLKQKVYLFLRRHLLQLWLIQWRTDAQHKFPKIPHWWFPSGLNFLATTYSFSAPKWFISIFRFVLLNTIMKVIGFLHLLTIHLLHLLTIIWIFSVPILHSINGQFDKCVNYQLFIFFNEAEVLKPSTYYKLPLCSRCDLKWSTVDYLSVTSINSGHDPI